MLDGVDVGVGEVAGPHRHQVTVGAEVRLEVVDQLTALADGQRGGDLAAVAAFGGQRDLVAVDGR